MAEFKKKLIFSKSYTTTANIAASAKAAERFISQEDIDQFAPFDTIIGLNQGTTSIGIHLDRNDQNVIPVSASGSVGAEDQRFSDFTIENTGVAILTAGQIRILVQKFEWVPIQ